MNQMDTDDVSDVQMGVTVISTSALDIVDRMQESSGDEEAVTTSASRTKRKARAPAFLRDDSDGDDEGVRAVINDAAFIQGSAEDPSLAAARSTSSFNGTKERKSAFLQGHSVDEKENVEVLSGGRSGLYILSSNSDNDVPSLSFYGAKKKKISKKRILKPVHADDSSAEEDLHDGVRAQPTAISVKERLNALANGRRKKQVCKDHESERSGTADEVKVGAEQEMLATMTDQASFLVNNDLFDAEGSSDDGNEDGLLEIKKKVKTAAQKARKESSRRPKRENVQQLHSESQRLLRESRTRLPRHVPLKKTLDEFLCRRKMVPKFLKAADFDIETVLKNVAAAKAEIIVSSSSVTEGEDAENIAPSSLECSIPVDDSGINSAVESLTANFVMELPDIDETTSKNSQSLEEDCQAEGSNTDSLKAGQELEFNWGTRQQVIGSTVFDDGRHQGTKCLDTLRRRISLLDPSLISRTPKLMGTPQELIFFDDDDDDKNLDKNGVDDLIDRFVQHTSVNKSKRLPQNQVVVNILKKETDGEGHEQLKNESITINLKPVETSVNQTDSTPGSRLKILKDGLKITLALKREEARKRRILLHKMDNETQFEDEEEEEEEEEEETSEETTTDDSEIEDEDMLEVREKKKKRNMFMDDEAAEDDDDGESDEVMEEDEQDEINSYNRIIEANHAQEALQATLSNTNNDDNRSRSPSSVPEKGALAARSALVNSDASLNSSLESLIPAHQPGGGFMRNNESDDFASQYEASQVVTRRFGISQFVVGVDSQPSQGQSQLSVRRQLELSTSDSHQESMDELFDLCSGKWTGDDCKALRVASLCDPTAQSTQENEAELFGLCSGRFNTAESVTQQKALHPAIKDLPEKCSAVSDDELSICSLLSLDVGHDRKRRKTRRVLSDTESEEGDTEESDVDSEDHVDKPVLPSRRKGANDFFEDEAELSGSEASSDEDEEIAIEDDILEEELGDQEYLSEDELREQVEKVHHKMIMDDDQRQLRIYKELYLEDGELHSDEQARMRKFRWRNIDDSQGNDDAKSDASDVEVDNDDEVDAQFRAQRHEREKWMTEYRNVQNDDVLLNKAESQFEQMTKNITIISRQDPPSKSPRKPVNIVQRGSFLNGRGKDYLAKLVGQSKSIDSRASKISGPTNSRNFVFAPISPPPPSKPEAKPAQLRRAATTPASSLTVSKRQRFCKQSSLHSDEQSQNSIFNLF